MWEAGSCDSTEHAPSLADAPAAVCVLVASGFGVCASPQDYVSTLRRLLRFDGTDRVSINRSVLRVTGFQASKYVFLPRRPEFPGGVTLSQKQMILSCHLLPD